MSQHERPGNWQNPKVVFDSRNRPPVFNPGASTPVTGGAAAAAPFPQGAHHPGGHAMAAPAPAAAAAATGRLATSKRAAAEAGGSSPPDRKKRRQPQQMPAQGPVPATPPQAAPAPVHIPARQPVAAPAAAPGVPAPDVTETMAELLALLNELHDGMVERLEAMMERVNGLQPGDARLESFSKRLQLQYQMLKTWQNKGRADKVRASLDTV